METWQIFSRSGAFFKVKQKHDDPVTSLNYGYAHKLQRISDTLLSTISPTAKHLNTTSYRLHASQKN